MLFVMPAPRIAHPLGGWLPQWLCEELSAQHGRRYRTNAVWTRCPRCDRIILTGLDDPAIAAAADVDPTPLTPLQDLICALEFRATYRLHLMGNTGRIQARSRYEPAAGTPGRAPVVPAHQCGQQFNGFIVPPSTERPHHAEPPF